MTVSNREGALARGMPSLLPNASTLADRTCACTVPPGKRNERIAKFVLNTDREWFQLFELNKVFQVISACYEGFASFVFNM